ncbi:hypothetical protein CLOM_g992 [Closterium sp. NIES-68]|nr:hypothetical protein CLOM_g992 [Closterium sp. NIES-68]GJP72572.1 hypothetical protein CLOP_g3289 [Closterium sp. NIES-67]
MAEGSARVLCFLLLAVLPCVHRPARHRGCRDQRWDREPTGYSSCTGPWATNGCLGGAEAGVGHGIPSSGVVDGRGGMLVAGRGDLRRAQPVHPQARAGFAGHQRVHSRGHHRA